MLLCSFFFNFKEPIVQEVVEGMTASVVDSPNLDMAESTVNELKRQPTGTEPDEPKSNDLDEADSPPTSAPPIEIAPVEKQSNRNVLVKMNGRFSVEKVSSDTETKDSTSKGRFNVKPVLANVPRELPQERISSQAPSTSILMKSSTENSVENIDPLTNEKSSMEITKSSADQRGEIQGDQSSGSYIKPSPVTSASSNTKINESPSNTVTPQNSFDRPDLTKSLTAKDIEMLYIKSASSNTKINDSLSNTVTPQNSFDRPDLTKSLTAKDIEMLSSKSSSQIASDNVSPKTSDAGQGTGTANRDPVHFGSAPSSPSFRRANHLRQGSEPSVLLDQENNKTAVMALFDPIITKETSKVGSVTSSTNQSGNVPFNQPSTVESDGSRTCSPVQQLTPSGSVENLRANVSQSQILSGKAETDVVCETKGVFRTLSNM